MIQVLFAGLSFDPEDGGTIAGTDIDTEDDVKDEADDVVVVEFVLDSGCLKVFLHIALFDFI